MTNILKKKSDLLDQIYQDVIRDLRGKIEVEHESMKAFCRHCEEKGLKPPNSIYLSSIWNGRREMGVGMYMRILIGLEIADQSMIVSETLHVDLSLKTYLKINHDLLSKSIFYITY